jgi:hypothetical protein
MDSAQMHRLGIALAAACLVAGCSTQAWYGAVQLAAENNCRRQPQGEVDACLARLNKMSYEDYERRRLGRTSAGQD